MNSVVRFIPRGDLSAQANLAEFIRLCRDDLKNLGPQLDWEKNHWQSAGVTFGNLDHKTRVLDPNNALHPDYIQFAKAYVRYNQAMRPTKVKKEMYALKVVERALIERHGCPDILKISMHVVDRAADLARERFSPGVAYQAGRSIERLCVFLNEKLLVVSPLDWRNQIARPVDTVRTGEKARAEREKKLPSEEVLNALAEIFASDPVSDKDIFTSSISAMLLSQPARAHEVLGLHECCEVEESRRGGLVSYGWRFQPGKGGSAGVKWIPDVMVDVAKKAVDRVRRQTEPARRVARWLEGSESFPHSDCPRAPSTKELSLKEVGMVLGIDGSEKDIRKKASAIGAYKDNEKCTLSSIREWSLARAPKGFPWLDKARGVRFSEGLFTMLKYQLNAQKATSRLEVWRPTVNTFNDDVGFKVSVTGEKIPNMFMRNGYLGDGIKVTSHQFRHLLNTMAQRGGLSQKEVAKWSGRADVKQNRNYDHVSEHEILQMVSDMQVSANSPAEFREVAAVLKERLPVETSDFEKVSPEAAHVTIFGYCVHEFVMSPCQRFRDCLNCEEHVCVKGEPRLHGLKEIQKKTRTLLEKAQEAAGREESGADRWLDVHRRSDQRISQLIQIVENDAVPNGAAIRLANPEQHSPAKRALESRRALDVSQPIPGLLRLMSTGEDDV